MSLLRRILKRVCVAVLASACGMAAAGGVYAVHAARLAGTLDALIAEIKETGIKDVQNITASIPEVIPHTEEMQYVEHAGLVEYFRKSVETLQKNYTEPLFSFSAWQILGSFSGRKTIVNVTSFFAPFFLICPQIYDPAFLRYDRTETSAGGKTIPGLRITTRLHRYYLAPAHPPMYALLYTETLSARVFGFTHAQLILPLSKNVGPAPQFDYNGMQDWKNHRHYGKEDQVKRAIPLTNFAHAAGEQYVVSSHPDFSLELKNYQREEAHLTFFLWRRDPVSTLLSRAVPLADAPPDFIFEIQFDRPSL